MYIKHECKYIILIRVVNVIHYFCYYTFYAGIEIKDFKIEYSHSEVLFVKWKVNRTGETCITGYELTVRKINSDNTTEDLVVIPIQKDRTYAFVQNIFEEGKRYELEIKAIGYDKSKKNLIYNHY